MPATGMVSLPIDEHIPRVIEALRGGRDIVIVAEPGAGKTTRIAPAIIRAGLLRPPHDKLVMLQPRRVAARAATARIALEQGWKQGEEVGYQVRFERIISRHTPLRVVTEGILVRQLVADPELAGIGCVVLDEFHERSIHSDLSVAMLREARAVRPDLRLIVMSATLDAEAVAAYLAGAAEVEIVHVAGRLFPVDVQYAGNSAAPVEERIVDVLKAYFETGTSRVDTGAVLGAAPGNDVLIFLPGAREIEATLSAAARLASLHGYKLMPLHGSLSRDEQDRAVSFDPIGPPRIICATNIAQTSLTLPGVRLVIDSGLVRQACFDAARGVEALITTRISKASADQRRGRAGRVAAGRCIRLWSKMTQHRLPDFDVPDVLRVDLSGACLALGAWGGHPTTFRWYQQPDPALLAAAQNVLEMLGAVQADRITPLGRELAHIPLHPREARLLSAAPAYLADEAATVAALLAEEAEVPGRRTANVRELLEAFERRRLDPATMRAVERARQALCSSIAVPSSSPSGTGRVVLEELLLLAYPDRVCRRRKDPALAKLVAGGGVRLAEPASVREEFFLALDVRLTSAAQKQQAEVRLVALVQKEWLERGLPQHIIREEVTTYEESSQEVIKVRRQFYKDLILDEQRAGPADSREAETLLREHLVPQAQELIEADDVLGNIYRRWHFVYGAKPTESGEVALPPEAELIWQACAGAASRHQVLESARDLAQRSLSRFRNPLDTWAPREIAIASGSRVRLDWRGSVIWRSGVMERHPPVLSVRLQELFGLAETPRVGLPPGVPVTLHILGPNFRPVQVTSDLRSFWQSTYPQVRKDLRARYPRHSWPEDPLRAAPVRGARQRPRKLK